ncbi:MAG: hypothetical protein ACLFUQ_01205 [Candidatus Izemoplasmataceae bacterium]
MRVCKHCGKSFHPVQTFQSLFSPPQECGVCEALLRIPLRSEHLPLYMNTLVLLTHDHPARPALVDDLFERVIIEDAFVIFHDSLNQAPPEAWRLMPSLLNPLILYYPDYPSFDVLERLLERFENELKNSRVSME